MIRFWRRLMTRNRPRVGVVVTLRGQTWRIV